MTAAGLHVPKGSLLWETYIEFEITVLFMIPVSMHFKNTDDNVKFKLIMV